MRSINMRHRNLLWPIVSVVLLLSLIVFTIINSCHLSDLELAYIRETSDETMAYIEQVVDSSTEENDRYIAYALAYAYNEQDTNELTANEIQNIIQEHFNISLSTEDINNIGITAYLFDLQISHRPEEGKYVLDAENLTQSQIAKIPITRYTIKNISKSGEKYYVEYYKFIVDNPYSILDYYQKQVESMSDEERISYSSAKSDGVYKYLTAQGKIKDAKAAIDEGNIEKVGRIDGGLKVTYIVKNDKLLVDKIEKIEQ